MIEVLTHGEALERLAPDWAALHARLGPGATPFQSPAWLLPWWRHIAEDGALLSLAQRDATGRLVALLPLWVHRGGEGPRLFPLGIGTSDYLDGLAGPGADLVGLSGALGESCHAAGLARIELPQLRPGSPLLALPAPAGWAEERMAGEACPVLPLPTVLRAALHPKTARDLRAARRRAEEAGLRCEEARSPEALEDFLAALLRLHAARWAGRGEAGVLAPARVQAAHRAQLPLLLEAGMLRAWLLRTRDGQAIAAIHALADPPDRPGVPRRLYLYLQGMDPAAARLGPGMVLLGHVLEQAMAEGFAEADFLRGQEAYKYHWGARDAATARRVLHRGQDMQR